MKKLVWCGIIENARRPGGKDRQNDRKKASFPGLGDHFRKDLPVSEMQAVEFAYGDGSACRMIQKDDVIPNDHKNIL